MFSAGVATITLGGSRLEISDALTVTGPGADALRIDGDGNSGVFDVAAGIAVVLEGLAVTGGNDGGIRNSGTLTLTDVSVFANSAGVEGGGIYNDGDLTIGGSTIRGNTAGYFGGGIQNWGTLSIANSTMLLNSSIVAAVTCSRPSVERVKSLSVSKR